MQKTDIRLTVWNQLQANGLRAYREIPEASCALAYRKDTKQFKRFIGKQDGHTLDVGCGIDVPGYLDRRNLWQTVGVDPLPSKGDYHPMARCQCRGESLPMADDWYDLVILAGTIDHVLDPAKVLSEASRVVRPTGRIIVQIGIPESYPRQTLTSRICGIFHSFNPVNTDTHIQDFVATLPVPDGCPDPFHFKYYTEPEIEALYQAAHLTIRRRRRIPGSTFYELRK